MPSPLPSAKVIVNSVSPLLFSFIHSFQVCRLGQQFCQLHQAIIGGGRESGAWLLVT